MDILFYCLLSMFIHKMSEICYGMNYYIINVYNLLYNSILSHLLMPCLISCSVSLVFIIAMVYMTYSTYDISNQYESQLSPELTEIYRKIVGERSRIYSQGFLLGIILSLLFLFYQVKFRKTKMSKLAMVCTVLSISFVVNYLYYTISPKSDYMLNHIKDEKQAKAWLEMYRQMKKNYHIGFLLGLVAVAFMGFAFC